MINNYKDKVLEYIEEYKKDSIHIKELSFKISNLGYRITSRKFLNISRVDDSDWLQNFSDEYCDSDLYRRCNSNDSIDLIYLGCPKEILKFIPNSGDDCIGFVCCETT